MYPYNAKKLQEHIQVWDKSHFKYPLTYNLSLIIYPNINYMKK